MFTMSQLPLLSKKPYWNNSRVVRFKLWKQADCVAIMQVKTVSWLDMKQINQTDNVSINHTKKWNLLFSAKVSFFISLVSFSISDTSICFCFAKLIKNSINLFHYFVKNKVFRCLKKLWTDSVKVSIKESTSQWNNQKYPLQKLNQFHRFIEFQ